MTRCDEVIRMARAAGFVLSDNATDEAIGRFKRFAALVAAAERDRCADAVAAEHLEGGPTEDAGDIAYDCAIAHAVASIRALKDGGECF